MLGSMDWDDWLTRTIAIYGAGLSTLVYWRSRRAIRVKCGFDESLGAGSKRLWCEVENPASVAVFVKVAKCIVRTDDGDKQTPIFGEPKLEAELLGRLEPGASRMVRARAEYEPFLAGKLKRIEVAIDSNRGASFSGPRLWKLKRKVRAALAREALAE